MNKTNDAIKRITEEAMKLNNPFATYIEEYLTNECTSDTVAEKILNPQKSLKEFTDTITEEMRAEAQKGGTGARSAGASDEYFYRRAREYYEIGKEKKKSSDVMNLFDFL